MPKKNCIDYSVRREWLQNEIDRLLSDETNDCDTVYDCILEINANTGILSVSQIYKALEPLADENVLLLEFTPRVIQTKLNL